MIDRVRALGRDDFLRHNAVFFLGSMVIAVLNYLYHPVLSRMMSVEDFGDVQVLFSIFTQASVILNVFGLIALNIFANQSDTKEESVRELYTFAFYIISAISLLLLIGAPLIQSSFQLGSSIGIVLVSLTLVILVFFTFGKFHLQAQHKFGAISVAGAISAGGKLLFAVVLVWLGLAVSGALLGLLIASVLAFFYVYRKTRHVVGFPRIQRLRRSTTLKQSLGYGILVFSATGLITLFFTLDIVFAKYFFSPEVAGLYSGVATVARIIFFVTASIAAVLLPHVKLSNTTKENTTLLIKALVIISILGGGAFLVMILFPTLVVGLLIGGKYLSLAPLLPLLSLHILLVALCNVLIIYLLALRRRVVIIAAIVGVVLMLTLSTFFHNSPRELVFAFLVSSASTLLFLVFSLLLLRKRNEQPPGYSPTAFPQAR